MFGSKQITRRKLVGGALVTASAVALAGCETGGSSATASTETSDGFRPAAKWVPQSVNYKSSYSKGTIVVDPQNFFLYLIEGEGKARRYGIAVGAAGRGFKGTGKIQRKAEWPTWTPTSAMLARAPERYAQFRNGVPGGPKNPMGARALYLYRGGRDTMFRIHGTNQPKSIGTSASAGCIRLINDHVEDLYDRVPVGTRVIVI